MERNTFELLHNELFKRRTELLKKVDADVVNKVLKSLRKSLSQHNLSSEQTEAILNYFYWFHYENDN
ncbi:hypothetical protein [Lysinibacillus xylanilyticus]|uniref:Uncharacterized protein n=1 Tax=Lysinibacillus xylanilyticus TaxID=582475 RepID=A0A2M9Q744_9BACI|nr:hypothetical protein [Lysinibacillus xylanilyticus]PJO43889.1 hypothetical protein CWD94_09865 [Lysinibacillus xylanilyticus]